MKLITNPGVFDPSLIETSPLAAAFMIAACVAAAVGVGLFVYSITTPTFKDMKHFGATMTSFAAAVIIGVVGGFVTDSKETLQADAAVAYNETVRTWLSDGYQIDATIKQTNRLINGEAFIIEYSGFATTVSLLETFGGEIHLVDEQKTLLPLTVPLNR